MMPPHMPIMMPPMMPSMLPPMIPSLGCRWNGKLEELSLEYCGIGCYGAGALAIDVVGNGYCKLT